MVGAGQATEEMNKSPTQVVRSRPKLDHDIERNLKMKRTAHQIAFTRMEEAGYRAILDATEERPLVKEEEMPLEDGFKSGWELTVEEVEKLREQVGRLEKELREEREKNKRERTKLERELEKVKEENGIRRKELEEQKARVERYRTKHKKDQESIHDLQDQISKEKIQHAQEVGRLTTIDRERSHKYDELAMRMDELERRR